MPTQQQTIEHLFGAALDLAPEHRAAFLDEACRDAPELRGPIDALLRADERLGNFLDQPILGPSTGRDGLSGEGLDGLAERLKRGEVSSPTLCFFEPEQILAGRFRVVRFLARGGMGEIYEVEDQYLQGVRVALKIILPQVALTEGVTHRFQQEVLLARTVIHPNLCPIYDIARAGEGASSFLFLTMKLLPGETLAARLRRSGSVSDEEAVSILCQLCAGLHALHTAGIIHRDIKPTNVMVEGSGPAVHVWIMDFGLARAFASEMTLEGSGLLAGTPGYLAPELLRGERPSQASDIYALGVLAHMIASNQARDLAESLVTVPSGSQASGPVPPLLQRAAREFRSEDPELRCTAFREIQEAFDAPGSRSRAVLAMPTANHGGRVISRRGFVVGAGASIAAAAGVAAVWNVDRLRDLLHPLPQKRFVALLKWPKSTDQKLRLVMSDVIDTIGRELSRVEAVDRNLLVISESAGSSLETLSELGSIRDSFGANLILAASGRVEADTLLLTLQVLDTSLKRPLRERLLRVAMDDPAKLSARAVQAAAELLGIPRSERENDLSVNGTTHPDAYAAFLAGEALRKENTAAALEESFPHYKEALSIDPKYAVAMAGLGRAYLRLYGLRKDPAALVLARENCEAAIEVDPSLVDAHQVLAWVYEKAGDRQKAAKELATALSLDPSDPNTLLAQAQVLQEHGRWQEATDRYHRVLKLRPNYWMAHQELGTLFNDSGDLQKALLEFRAASLAVPRNCMAANNVGSVLLQEGKLQEAEDILKRSFSLEPNDAAAANLATLFRVRGRLPESLLNARAAVTLNPREPRNLLELADTLIASNLRPEALDTYKKAADTAFDQMETETANGPVCMLLALLRAKTGNSGAAPSLLEKADHLGAEDLDSQLFKVRTLELLGKRSEALAALERSLDRGATVFQAQTIPDLESLRTDPRYRALISTSKSYPGSET